MNTSVAAFITDAKEAATAAAATARVTVRILDCVDDFTQVVELFRNIWKSDASLPPVNVETLRAVSKSGSYVGGAFDGSVLEGACFGFYGAPGKRTFHSHIAGVRDGVRGRNVGFAMKTHQRAWALENEVDTISWTFDPLISRNAYFNLVKLAAHPAEYLENFYGHMADDINGADDTDRLLVRWDVWSEAVAAASRGEHRAPNVPYQQLPAILITDPHEAPVIVNSDAATVRVGLPRDIENIRHTAPATATAWRLALRQTLGAEMRAGATVTGFDRAGNYIVTRGEKQ